MYLEEIGEELFIVLCGVILILAFVIPIGLFAAHARDKDIELEKYKIEMELQKELIPKDVLKEDR